MKIIDQIYRFIDKEKLILPQDKIVVGVSGGADSIALLYILYELRDRLEIELVVAHLDHQLRPGESEKDCLFVKEQAQMLKLPFFSANENVALRARMEGLSIEDAARKTRYEFYSNVASLTRAQKVAVGHTRDDQAETLLQRILRGTGPEGLEGMSPLRTNQDLTIVRPLLGISRILLRKYIKDKNLIWREDVTNEDEAFTRNKIRKSLIPYLEKEFNPSVQESLGRLSDILTRDNDYLNKEVAKVFEKLVKPVGKRLCLNIEMFRTLDLSIQRRLLRNMFFVFSPFAGISFNHIQSMIHLINFSQSGRQVPLSQYVHAWVESDYFFMGSYDSRDVFQSELLNIPGETVLRGKWAQFKIVVQRMPRNDINNMKSANFSFAEIVDVLSKRGVLECSEYFDGDKIKNSILIRPRKDGDLYDPIGLGGHKKVKDIFIDEKVPLRFRGRIPIFLMGEKIIWIAGFRISESFKIRPESREIVEINLQIST